MILKRGNTRDISLGSKKEHRMFVLVSPKSSVVAGAPATIHLRYTHQGRALPSKSAIRIGFTKSWGDINLGARPLTDLQCLIKVRGNAALTAPPTNRRSITFFPGAGVSNLTILDLAVTAKGLASGESLDIIIGDDERGVPRFIPGIFCGSALKFYYHIDRGNRFPLCALHPDAPGYLQYIAPDGSDFPEWRSCGVSVNFKPDRPVHADLSLPSVAVPGKSGHLRVVVYDKYFNPIPDFEGGIEPVTRNGLKFQRRRFSTGKNGFCLLPVVFEKQGLMKDLMFRISGLGVFRANPVRVEQSPKTLVLWGDLHGHSNLSDGDSNPPESFFEYARDIRGLDFAALCDHSFGLAVGRHWAHLRRVVARFFRKAGFAPFLGYEIMTDCIPTGKGHRNIYFPPGADGRFFMADYQPGAGGSFRGERYKAYQQIWNKGIPRKETLKELLDALEGCEHLYGVHSCGDIVDEERDRITLFEVCSEWGISEEGDYRQQKTGGLVTLQQMFFRGLSPGIIGASDDHTARGGFMGRSHVAGPARYPSGLAAVICASPDGRAIYASLLRKHCYATTGARILLEPSVKRDGNTLLVNMRICGTDYLDRMWVMKNGREVFHAFCGSSTTEWMLSWKDVNFQQQDTCYIRVTQADGHAAWINPVPFTSVG